MIPDIIEHFPTDDDGKQYATLTHAEVKHEDMGEKSITTQVRIDGDIVPDFSSDWAVEFQGEKYIMPLRIPQGQIGDTLDSTIDLTFQHWAVYQLKRWPFVTIQHIETGTAIADEEVAPVQLNLGDFCTLFGQVLAYWYGDTITIDLNPDWEFDSEPVIIEISHTKVWDVLIEVFHKHYGVRWEIKPAADNDNSTAGGERYVIYVGYSATEIDHIFELGFEGGLLKIERQVQNEDIHNMVKGRGGSDNLPRYYFKEVPEEERENYFQDPDWVSELSTVYFTNLMPATFRSYVQGWKAHHKADYPGYEAVGESNAYSPWAYRKGFTDTKFLPVEFVADEITVSPNPSAGDRQIEILPGFSPWVRHGSSLDKYGPLLTSFDNNEEFYPSIQGSGMDIAVDVEEIKSDDVEGSTEEDAQLTLLNDIRGSVSNLPHGVYADILIDSGGYFKVDEGCLAELNVSPTIASVRSGDKYLDPLVSARTIGAPIIKVYDAVTGAERTTSGIPPGNWRYTVRVRVQNITTDKTLDITVEDAAPQLTGAHLSDPWKNTFSVWVKNIWDTTKLTSETDAQYAERVWRPVLGDREGNSPKLLFTTGNLAHEDYEFPIVGFPVYDTSKGFVDKQGTRHLSHWRITLDKSDAELEATGLYLPSTKRQGSAGDKFVFLGSQMTQHYVDWAERRLDDWKTDSLGEIKEIKPTVVVTTDRVRLSNEGRAGALISQIRAGRSLRISDKRFITPEEGQAYAVLYLQSVTYTYREPSSDDAALNPDVAVVLGNDYTVSASPVSQMQGEISSMQRILGSVSNVEQIVRAVGDKLYLRKDGIPDRSFSPTEFYSLLTGGGFRSGLVGGAGWGFFKDDNGNWVLETDRINVRQEMTVNTLVINQVEGRGGMQVDTAAYITEVTHVREAPEGFYCYFDQRGGSVANLFQVGDVAYCNRWTPRNAKLKFYKRRVTETGADYILLAKSPAEGGTTPEEWPDSGVNGSGVPAEGDCIIHFGSYTSASRQYVKVRDVVGGGYERFLDGLDSVNASGTEYYFVGRQTGMYNGRPRFYLGDSNGYIEWKDGKLTIKGSLSLQSTIGDKSIGDYISDEVGKAAGALLLDLDDELVPLSCDAQGTVLSGLPFSTEAHVYRGPAEEGGWAFSGKATGCTASVNRSTGVVSVTAVSADTATVEVTATKTGQPTLTATLNIYKVIPGGQGFGTVANVQRDNFTEANWDTYGTLGHIESWTDTAATRNDCRIGDIFTVTGTSTDGGRGHTLYYRSTTDSGNLKGECIGHTVSDKGDAATVYKLLPSVDKVSRDVQGNLSQTSVDCIKQKITGDSPVVSTTELYLYAQVVTDSASSWSLIAGPGTSSGSVTIDETTTAVIFELRSGNVQGAVVFDRERVPVLSDASGLEIGGTNMLRNSDFLDGLEHWCRIEDFKDVLSISPDAELDGRKSLTLDSTGQPASWFFQIHQEVAARPLTDYSISFYAKSDDYATTVIRLMIGCYDADGNMVTEALIRSINDQLNGADWSYVSLTFKTPANVAAMYVNISMNRAGSTVSINGPKLEQGNLPTPWSLSPLDGGYLRSALRGQTKQEGGLALMTMIETGEWDAKGNFYPKSGLNGTYDKTQPGGGIAMWAGGEPKDRASAGVGDDGATMLFRMDGTGYAAGNTLKFLADELRVGLNDVIRLNKQGLFMYDAEGNVRMRLADEPVKFNLNELGSTKSTFGSLTNYRMYQAAYNDDFSYLGFANEATVLPTYGQGTISAGAVITVQSSASITVSITTPPVLHPVLNVAIEKQNGTKWDEVAVFRGSLFPSMSNPSLMSAEVNLSHIVTEDGNYQVRPYITSSVARPSTGLTNAPLRFMLYGERYTALTGTTAIGNNGLMSVWPQAAFGINESGFVARVGNLGIKIDPALGIMATLDGSNWGYLGFTLNNGSTWSPLKV